MKGNIKNNQWILSSTSKELFKLFLQLNKDNYRKIKLSYSVMKMPIFGFLIAKFLCLRTITFLKNGDTTWQIEGLTIPLLETYILRNWKKIYSGSSEAPPSKLAFLIFVKRRGINFFVASEKRIILFGKYMFQERLEFMLEEEYKNIKYLHAKLNGALKKSASELCFMEKLNGHNVLITDYMSGRRMSENVSYNAPSRNIYEVEKSLMRIIKWLVGFQKENEVARIKIALLEDEVKSLLSEYTSLVPLSNGVHSFFSTQVMSRIRELGEMEIPLVVSHGDFFHSNILIEGENVKVVDWADMKKEELPTNDIFKLFLSTRLFNIRKDPPEDDLDSFRSVFLEENWFSILTKRCFDWYCAEMGIEKNILNLLFQIYLLKQVVSESNGSNRDKMVIPHEWTKSLLLYKNNRRNFILNE